jgi:hypothetical protein
VSEFGQVECDLFVLGEELPDLGIEKIVDTRDQPAFASHDSFAVGAGFAVGTFYLKRKSTRGCFDGHKGLALSGRMGPENGIGDCRILH